MLFAYLIHKGWFFFGVADYDKREYIAKSFPWLVATTTLLIAIGCRQNWARYFLAVVLVMHASLNSIPLFLLMHSGLEFSEASFRVISILFVDALIICGVLNLKSIRRLVSRQYE
jgi:hypothetical protein